MLSTISFVAGELARNVRNSLNQLPPASARSTSVTEGFRRSTPSISDASSPTMKTVPKVVSSSPRMPSISP